MNSTWNILKYKKIRFHPSFSLFSSSSWPWFCFFFIPCFTLSNIQSFTTIQSIQTTKTTRKSPETSLLSFNVGLHLLLVRTNPPSSLALSAYFDGPQWPLIAFPTLSSQEMLSLKTLLLLLCLHWRFQSLAAAPTYCKLACRWIWLAKLNISIQSS